MPAPANSDRLSELSLWQWVFSVKLFTVGGLLEDESFATQGSFVVDGIAFDGEVDLALWGVTGSRIDDLGHPLDEGCATAPFGKFFGEVDVGSSGTNF